MRSIAARALLIVVESALRQCKRFCCREKFHFRRLRIEARGRLWALGNNGAAIGMFDRQNHTVA